VVYFLKLLILHTFLLQSYPANQLVQLDAATFSANEFHLAKF